MQNMRHQTLRFFSSGHLAMIPIAVALGFIADSAPMRLSAFDHPAPL